MRPRVLFVTDSARISSGFGRVVREVATRLHKTGKYEIAQHGWFDHLAIPDHQVPFPIFPTRRMHDGNPHPQDGYGRISFDDVVVKWNPDLVIGIGDPPFLDSIFFSALRYKFRCMFYCPADGFPLDTEWEKVLRFPDRLILFGEWPKQLVKSELGIDCHGTIYHGMDTDVFHPADLKARLSAKQSLLKDYESFIFGFIGRNSERKRVDLVLQAVSLIRYGYYGYCSRCSRYVPDPMDNFGKRVRMASCKICKSSTGWRRGEPRKVKLLLHTPSNDRGASLERMVRSFEMRGLVYIDPTYKVTQGVSDRRLVEYYWAMDCYLSFAMEGFGFPILEAMSCGVPVITGNYSAPPEWCKDGSLLVEPEIWMTEQRASLLRPVPDMGQFIEHALRIMDDPSLRDSLGVAGREKALSMSWDVIAKQWEEQVDAALPETTAARLEI